MKREDRIILRFSIAVSIRCNTDDNPLPENPTPEQAADYIQNVLEILFAKTGKTRVEDAFIEIVAGGDDNA